MYAAIRQARAKTGMAEELTPLVDAVLLAEAHRLREGG